MKINVLDRGYVRLVDHMGSDLSVVNSARVSYAKQSKELSPNDSKLIQFLAREGHTSPFRHATVQLEFYAPLMVARQHWKYVVGSDHTMDAWNEASRRYITIDVENYVPQPLQWRSKPEHSKQGSGEPMREDIGREATERLMRQIEQGMKDYEWALEQGIAPEQARLLIPSAYGMYTAYYWTASLQSVSHFLNQRLAHDSQYEIQQYAQAVYDLVQPLFPVSLEQLLHTP
ncbi:FAD-dependent thymidylate synthase [Paenibacillus sp. MER TA 81-3]|uniref:FAD-dependent thymidylate synthase n=1 Tax=Paenibacillus sp. MER TA 81-3 TaxID=2939573 RepID=UPI0020426BCC|nr:FAD-dependent thymidylate synthase [Paenibacillus sp. MER TA 81-3]MCM3338473.1 FAD-dependent thymidylate synthase [Paenibacillus sp. MER TA 81-3]